MYNTKLKTNMKSTETEIAVLQTQMENIEKKVDDGFKSLKGDNERIEKIILDFMEKSEKKFADKWVEKAVSWAGYFIIAGVLTALMAVVLSSSKS
jgi:DNA helicase IV